MKVVGNLCCPGVGHKYLIICSLDKIQCIVFPLASESKKTAPESQAIYIFLRSAFQMKMTRRSKGMCFTF